MGALLIALLLGGMALAMAQEAKAKQLPPGAPPEEEDEESPLPVDEEPAPPEQAGAEAVSIAQQAAEAAAKAAREAFEAMAKGQQEKAAEKAEEARGAAEEATRAGDAAAPTEQAANAAELAKQAADAAIKAAQAAGIPIPDALKAPPGEAPTSDMGPDDVLVKSPGQPTQVISDQEARAVKEAEAAIEPSKAPAVPAVSNETALPAEETKPENDPSGTIALARLLLERETAPGWREAMKDAVKNWQIRLGLTADGKFGPKGALRMAEEVGILPLVRFWPAGSQKASALADYRASVRALADTVAKQRDGEAHAAALRQSAQVEDARAYGNPNAAPLTSAQRAGVGG